MIEARSTRATRLVATAYRRGWLPPRGYGKLFSSTPASWWGGPQAIAQTAVGDLVVKVRDPGAQHLLAFGALADEHRESAFMRRLLGRVGVFVDVGATYGWYSRMAWSCNGEAMVVAIEANPELLPLLGQNVGPGATVVHAMVTDQAGEGILHLCDNSTMSSATREVGVPVVVPAVTIDEIAGRFRCQPDLIKCDVEGGEMAVLRGAARVRSHSTPPLWLIEVYERYLLDGGESYEALHAEFSRFGPMEYFCPDERGQLVSLQRFEELRGSDRFNVVAVPAARLGLIADLIS
ncbi:MAG: FkbM family methyltransferase [Acidimicrobiia bacterium]